MCNTCLPKKEDAIPHPGTQRNRLEWEPNWHFGVLVGTWNTDNLSGNGDVCEELRKMANVSATGEMESNWYCNIRHG